MADYDNDFDESDDTGISEGAKESSGNADKRGLGSREYNSELQRISDRISDWALANGFSRASGLRLSDRLLPGNDDDRSSRYRLNDRATGTLSDASIYNLAREIFCQGYPRYDLNIISSEIPLSSIASFGTEEVIGTIRIRVWGNYNTALRASVCLSDISSTQIGFAIKATSMAGRTGLGSAIEKLAGKTVGFVAGVVLDLFTPTEIASDPEHIKMPRLMRDSGDNPPGMNDGPFPRQNPLVHLRYNDPFTWKSKSEKLHPLP